MVRDRNDTWNKSANMIEVEKIGEIRKFRLARTVLGRPLYFTAAYWIDGLMVDTGCYFTVSELLDALKDVEVKTIINTHSHEDHVAGNAALKTRYGAEIAAHPEAIHVLSNPGKQHLRPYQHAMWGRPEPSTASRIGEVVETDRYRFKVIHTPGHSRDHICLFEPEQGWLFTGDAYVGGRDRALRHDYNIWQIIESLKKMAQLEVRLLLPGSGNERYNGREELLSKITYLEDMGEKVLEYHARGWSRRRIRKRLFGPEMAIAYITLGHFSGLNLVRSYIEDSPQG